MRWQRTNWQLGEIRKADLEWMEAVPGGGSSRLASAQPNRETARASTWLNAVEGSSPVLRLGMTTPENRESGCWVEGEIETGAVAERPR